MNIMFSTVFPSTHPRKGEPTDFVYKILSGEKRHTVRKNYAHWAKHENNRVALCTWSGIPYRSKVKPFATAILRINKIGIHRPGSVYPILTTIPIYAGRVGFYGVEYFAKEDGLSIVDFESWFRYDLSSIVGCACVWLDGVQPMDGGK